MPKSTNHNSFPHALLTTKELLQRVARLERQELREIKAPQERLEIRVLLVHRDLLDHRQQHRPFYMVHPPESLGQQVCAVLYIKKNMIIAKRVLINKYMVSSDSDRLVFFLQFRRSPTYFFKLAEE